MGIFDEVAKSQRTPPKKKKVAVASTGRRMPTGDEDLEPESKAMNPRPRPDITKLPEVPITPQSESDRQTANANDDWAGALQGKKRPEGKGGIAGQIVRHLGNLIHE